MNSVAGPQKITMIGVGRMGAVAVEHLAGAGHRVTAYDVVTANVERLGELATPATSVTAAIAGADIVLLSLRGPDDVVEVTTEIATAAAAGTTAKPTVIDLSTIDPPTAQQAAARLADVGIDYLDAPVLGRPERAGQWTLIVGGDAAAIERVTPVLTSSIAARVVRVGDSGAGCVIKLMNNLMLGAINAITAEALAVCSAAGVDPGVFVDVVADSGAASVSPMFRDIAPRIVAGDFDPTFTVALMHKDNRLAVNFADHVGVPTVVGAAVHQLNTLALQRFAGDDSAAVIKVIEAATGIEARRHGATDQP